MRLDRLSADWHMEITFDIVFQAHGLRFDVTSKETSFDLHTHCFMQQTLAPRAGAICYWPTALIIAALGTLFDAVNDAERFPIASVLQRQRLIKLAASKVTQTGACTPEVMWRKLFNTGSFGCLFDDLPKKLWASFRFPRSYLLC